MTPRASRRAATLLLFALLSSGCTLASLPTTAGGAKAGTGHAEGGSAATGGQGGNTTTAGVGTPVHNQPLEPLNGVEFKPITAASTKFLAANGNGIIASGGGNIVSSGGGNIAPQTTVAASGNIVSNGGAGGMAMTNSAAPATAPAADVVGAAPAAPAVKAGVATQPLPPPKPAIGPTPNTVGGAFSGNVYANYGYNYYFGGFGSDQQMALVSLLQAETAGSSGGFADAVGKVAGPIVKAWANDARLVASSALLDNQGNVVGQGMTPPTAMMPVKGGAPGGDPNAGWSLTYASTSRLEVLTFAITPAKTTILRMRWEPLNLDPTRVTTDSGAAVQKLIAAIQDKSFAGEEEKTGNDYFLGFKFDQPQTGQFDGDYQRTEVVYQVPPDARWNVSLQEVMGKLVWQLNFYASDAMVAMPMAANVGPAASESAVAGSSVVSGGNVIAAGGGNVVAAGGGTIAPIKPCPQPVDAWQPGWFNNSGSGMVDAETGAVIRFTRPTRTSYRSVTQPDCGIAVDPPVAVDDGATGAGTVTATGTATPTVKAP